MWAKLSKHGFSKNKKKLALSYRSYITSSDLDSKILTLIFLKILTIESLSYLRGSLEK